MKILYIDIDSLRADHLGCYGYHRKTSPVIDSIAQDGMRYDNYYVADAPCLPSRTGMFSGRFGIRNGVVNHGGVASELFQDGAERGFRSKIAQTNWMTCLRKLGLHTASISSFGERHSAFHFLAGFNEIMNGGGGGNELGDQVAATAMDWLKRNGSKEHWFLHVNLWDPHTPYRTPLEWGNPFENDPLPAWLTEQVRQQHWASYGPHSAQEVCGFRATEPWVADYPQQPVQMDSMTQVRRMFDGYDRGVRYADEQIGKILNTLADLSVLEETAIIISADHGENLGELNIYGDHQTADQITSRVPLIVKWPGGDKGVDQGLHYHFDFAATVIERLGGEVPENWDGRFMNNGRDYLVLGQGAWSCQRAVRFDDWICIRTYHDGYHPFPEVMLFDVKTDPHQENNLAEKSPDVVQKAIRLLTEWEAEMTTALAGKKDPMKVVMDEGGPYHTRGQLPDYLKRLQATGRGHHANDLLRRHPKEAV